MSLQSLPSQARPSTPELRVNAHGFSLHAAVRWRADQRKELEQLCRYITRPAIANERLKLQPRRPSRAATEESLQRRHHPYRHGAARVHGAPGGPGAAAALTSDPLPWRCFDIDIEHCPNCGGSLNIAHSHNRRIELNDEMDTSHRIESSEKPVNPRIAAWFSAISRGRDRPCERPPARIRT